MKTMRRREGRVRKQIQKYLLDYCIGRRFYLNRIAAANNCTTETVRLAIKDLEKQGKIEVEKWGKGKATSWYLTKIEEGIE